jgi:hypothetical protein
MASGPGLGFASIASITTTVPNNDDSPGAQPDNNLVFPFLRFDTTGYIDIPFTVTATAGVTEYQVSESVDNNTGARWNSYRLLLGFGTGTGFTQVGGIGDGLDFDTGPPGGNTTPPTSVAMPAVTRANEDSLVFSGGTQGAGAQQYQFRIDVSDLIGRSGTFTLRQQPVALLGDYNGNAIVDPADYVVWRNSLGQTGSNLAADGNGNGIIDNGDYAVWRSHFGQTAVSGTGVGANAPVTEPETAVLMIMAGMIVICARRLRTCHKLNLA